MNIPEKELMTLDKKRLLFSGYAIFLSYAVGAVFQITSGINALYFMVGGAVTQLSYIGFVLLYNRNKPTKKEPDKKVKQPEDQQVIEKEKSFT